MTTSFGKFLAVITVTLSPLGTSADDEKDDRAAHLLRMKELAGSIHVYATPGREDSEAKLIGVPVLRYTDNTRRLYESSLWIWGEGGRPSAIVAIEFYPNSPKGPRWLYEIASLSTEPIAAERGKDLSWTAKEPGLKLQKIASTGDVEVRPALRLAQMKELSRRFAAYETAAVGGRIDLRPLTTPLYRYADPENDVTDGAIFSFANGTNPEVLLVVEAHGKKNGSANWYFGLAQMTGAAVVVNFDGKEIWSRGEADPPATRDSYVNGWIESSK